MLPLKVGVKVLFHGSDQFNSVIFSGPLETHTLLRPQLNKPHSHENWRMCNDGYKFKLCHFFNVVPTVSLTSSGFRNIKKKITSLDVV